MDNNKEKITPECIDEETKSCEPQPVKKKEAPILIKNGFLNDKQIDTIIFILALCMGVIHVVYANYIFMSLEIYRTMHLCFALAIGIALVMKLTSKRGVRIINLGLIALVAFCFLYIYINVDAIRLRQWMNTDLDLIVGAILMAMAFYTTIKHFGWVLPVLTLLVVIYPMFGKYMPGALQTTSYSIKQTITNLSIGLQGGVYSLMSVSANYIFLFAIFGGVMSAVGVSQLFSEIGKLIAGRSRSASALTTCITQAMFGTVIANGMATAQMTAPYSLPNMEDAGYKKVTAASILAAASNGGKILPPVMGALGFAIAGFANISYWTVAKMALLPALLYYACIMWYAHLEALKIPSMRIKQIEKPKVNWQILKWKGPVFFIPFTLIIVMMAKGQPITKTACYAMAVILVLGFVTKKEFRPSWRNVVKNFSSGAVTGSKIACCVACVGMMITTFSYSGLNVKLAASIEAISGGSLFVVVLIIFAISIVAGMAGVVIAAYITIATFAVSVLQSMGVSYEVAHFFSAYPSFMATLTPPVAVLTLVVSKLAGTPYGKTSWETCKVAFTGFIMPFVFCYAPAICLMDTTGVWRWIDISIVVLFSFAVQTAFCGWLLEKMSIVERLVLGSGCAVLFTFLMFRHMYLLGIGLALVLIVIAVQVIKRKKNGSELRAQELSA